MSLLCRLFRVCVRLSSVVVVVLLLEQPLGSKGGTGPGEEEGERCGEVRFSPESLVVASEGNLLEIHVRQNIEGEIVIEDEEKGRSRVELDVFRFGSSESEVSGITINHTLIDVGPGNIFLLQVDYVKRQKAATAAVVGFVLIGVISLLMLSLVFWFVCKRSSAYLSSISRVPLEGVTNPGIATVDQIESNFSQVDGLCSGSSPIHEELIVGERNHDLLLVPCAAYDARVYDALDTRRHGDSSCPPPAIQEEVRTAEVKRFGMTTSLSLLLCVASVVSAALCPLDPTAQIVIHLLPNSKLNAVKLFFNRAHRNRVEMKGWSGRNRTQLEIYDLDSASASESLPCYARTVCPYAYIQNLAACDGATGQCVCIRGYEFDRGVCVDEDECVGGRHRCPASSTCQNDVGSYSCHCQPGFFGNNKFCQECSVGCPPGSFQSLPCTKHRDRVCSECSRCDGSTFELRPCSAVSDRQCLHVAHPSLLNVDVASTSFTNEMKVETSSNVYLEDLQNTRGVDSTYHVTDVSRALELHWDRESGLRVSATILNIRLIPKYEDVAHDGDNDYMLSNQNSNEDKTKFQNVVRHYCRNPIPDYYSITLEIHRDRTTAASEVICDSRDQRKPRCPPSLTDGDTFLHRTLNNACQQMGTFPDPLKQAENSIVCTDGSGLLRDIFNQSYTPERPIPFPSRKCRAAKSRCDQCLNQQRCLAQDVFERKCCHIECFTLVDCKQTASKECSNISVECAMGDAYRYTIQPVFQNIKTEFQCHIQRVRFEALYDLFYFIEIPNTGFQTPKIQRRVYAEDISYLSHGEFTSDYLTVEHSTGLDLSDEFILIGHENENNRFSYKIHSMKTDEDGRKKKVVVHGISPNIFVASVQFERPFDYSTSNWMRSNDCNKNVSKLRTVQRSYGTDARDVSAALESDGGGFKYAIRANETAPYLRFVIPGNMSILAFYFEGNGPYLFMNSSLRTRLTLTAHGRLWEITISGKMSDCPAYLGVTISSRLDLDEELFRYDALILCPSDFNLTFRIPNWAQHSDKAFNVRLQDAIRSHSIYLTQLAFEEAHSPLESEVMNSPNALNVPLNFLLAFASVTLVLLIVFSISYIYKEVRTSQFTKEFQKVAIGHPTKPTPDGSVGRLSVDAEESRSRTPRLVAGLYFAFWATYSLGVTFTMFFVIVSLLTRDDLVRLTEVSAFRAELLNVSVAASETVRRSRVGELGRQRQTLKQMQSACAHYIGQLFTGLTFNIEKVIEGHHRTQMYGPRSSIGQLLATRNQRHLQSYVQRLEDFSNDYRSSVTSSMAFTVTTYHRYLRSAFHSDWFSFPQRLFNSSDADRHLLTEDDADQFSFLGYEADFGVFLEIEELEQVKLWPLQFWERYFSGLPESTTFNVPIVNRSHLHCAVDNNRSVPNMTRLIHLDRIHSFRFFSSRASNEDASSEQHLLPIANTGSDFLMQETKEFKYSRFYDDVPHLEVLDDVISAGLWIVFLVLDALLLVYRFTTMYSNGLIVCRHFNSSSSHRILSNSESAMSVEGTLVSSAAATDAKHPENVVPDFASPVACETSSDAPHSRTNCSKPLQSYRLICACSREGLEVTQSSDTVSPARWSSVQSNGEAAKLIAIQILQSSTFLKFLVAGIVLLLSYVIVRTAALVLDVRVFIALDCFNIYINAIRTQMNESDCYLLEEAQHLNQLAISFYRNHVQSELANLQVLLEYFNSEQRRLQMNYVSEACSIHKVPQANWSCGINIKLPPIEFPIIPCNFLPLHPVLHSGFQAAEYEAQLSHALTPFLALTRNFIMRTLCICLTLMITVLVIHISASILNYCFGIRESYEIRPQGVEKEQTRPAELLESVSHSEGINVGREAVFHPNIKKHRVHHLCGNTLSHSKDCQRTQLMDFKYSETIV